MKMNTQLAAPSFTSVDETAPVHHPTDCPRYQLLGTWRREAIRTASVGSLSKLTSFRATVLVDTSLVLLNNT